MIDGVLESDSKAIEVRNKPSDWRLQYVIDYFILDKDKWELVDKNKLRVVVPLEDDQGNKTQFEVDISPDNLVRIPMDLSRQTGPDLVYQPTSVQEQSQEGGLVLLLNSFSLSLPTGEHQGIKKLRPENKRFQDLKLVFFPEQHPSYVDSSVYYPRVNTLHTPFPRTMWGLIGVGHEMGHCLDSNIYPLDFQSQPGDESKSKKALLEEQIPREDRAWQEIKSLYSETNVKGATQISEKLIDKFIGAYVGNYKFQADEALDL